MLPRRETCPTVLRAEFNRRDFEGALLRGEVILQVTRAYPTPATRGQVAGTVSQMVEYRTPEGDVVARAFRYLRPDGTVGASGRADPKYLVVEGEVWFPPNSPDHSCEHCRR